MSHRERCRQECTRDVIFLFQERANTKSANQWRTVDVWLDRAEATAWGESQRHNYGEKGVGWQVYGIPAAGQLAALLRSDPVVQPTGKDS